MSSNNKTELILGVSHIPEFLRVTRDVLEAKFPGGLESLMLELPPWYANVPEEDIDRNEYFSRIKKAYEQRGVKIVYGDINRRQLPKKVDDICREFVAKVNAGESISSKEILKNVYASIYVFGDPIMTAFRDILFHTRCKGMLNVMETAQPKAVVAGNLHAKYLKKAHPEIQYVALVYKHLNDERFIDRFVRLFDISPHNADELIDVSTYHAKRVF